jgi:hypothetical protein
MRDGTARRVITKIGKLSTPYGASQKSFETCAATGGPGALRMAADMTICLILPAKSSFCGRSIGGSNTVIRYSENVAETC